MLYSMYDKFLVRGVLCEVKYINLGKAWLFPVEDAPGEQGRVHLTCVSFEVLDSKGKDRQGKKAEVVNNTNCGAV